MKYPLASCAHSIVICAKRTHDVFCGKINQISSIFITRKTTLELFVLTLPTQWCPEFLFFVTGCKVSDGSMFFELPDAFFFEPKTLQTETIRRQLA